jgi:soluble lytic murein transglycosylase-like protein
LRLLLQFGLIFALAAPAVAAENAVLRNGFSIRHEGRAEVNGVTRLFTSETDYVEVATADITGYEPAPEPPQAAPAPAKAEDLDAIIQQLSRKYGLDAELIRAVIRAESAFNHRAVSPKGARGLMQLMPATATELGVQDSFDPAANVEGGTRYLRELLARHGNDLAKALAAYNAGPGAVQRHRGIPPYRETIRYIRRIITDYNRAKLAQRKLRASAD